MRNTILICLFFHVLSAGAQDKIMKIHLKTGYTAFFSVNRVDSVTYGDSVKVHQINGSIASFTTTSVDRVSYENDANVVMDIDDNVYPTVVIGSQTWMADNLRTTKYRNGTAIQNITDNTQWQNNTSGAWSYYEHNTNNNYPYGKLYNWHAVNNMDQICPTGWHIPSDTEWSSLINLLDPGANSGNNPNTAGGKMKSTGTQYWLSPNTYATNIFGWSGLPGGLRHFDGSFFSIGINGLWWSSSERTSTEAFTRFLYYFDSDFSFGFSRKISGLSVRCLKDFVPATISALNCASATNNGTLNAGTAASSVSSGIPYAGGNGGGYSTQSINSTGVTGLTATLTEGLLANGSGTLSYTITGTPATSGTASFALSIGGQTCTLTRTVNFPIPATISTLNCASATNNGTLTAGTAASSVSSSVPYAGGNGGTYAAQTISSTGITGLTATLTAGSVANGSGSLSYNITGTPATSGTASFALSIGGQSCTLTRTVNPPAANLGTLNCAGATNNGTLTAGTAASSVSSSVPYTGGNGGTYAAQTISSTGVTGLTATLNAGLVANGSGSLSYTISGTPATSGTASFALSIGGQSCTLTRTVSAATVTGITAHTCGATNVHNATIPYGTMTDQEGNVYRTVQIGSQTWMAENLKTTKYRNGTSIPNITNDAQWDIDIQGAYCSYNNNSANDCPYGKLYNWYAVNNGNQLCPTGWHVPTDTEWTTLITFLGGESLAGGKMKSTGTQFWLNPNDGATNSSGWSGLPGGIRPLGGPFSVVTFLGYWWSSTENPPAWAWYRSLVYGDGTVGRSDADKTYGLSVRCLKD